MRTSFFALTLLLAAPGFAQHSSRTHAPSMSSHKHAHAAQSPYVGMNNRTIKALSEQQISDLQGGKGMLLALPAELNGYPGPSHVIEMAEALELSQDQLLQTERLFNEMQTEAKVLGEQVVARESELDHLFKDRKATPANVQNATARAAQVQGQLRAAHLKYHIAMVEILTPNQVSKYTQLRGY